MDLPVVFMFSGQSSQYFRMGAQLYERHPRFRMWMDHCDEIAAPLIGCSICEVLYGDKNDKAAPFDRLLHTNPALVSFEFSLARVLMEAGATPSHLLGYSLGEVSAAVVGGALSLEQGLEFVVDYARLLESESPPARMMAVIDAPMMETRYAEPFHGCWITARNFDRHVVVTGPVASVQRLQEALLRDGVVHQLLAVKYGFHTPMLEPLKSQVTGMAQKLNFSPLRIPFVSCEEGSVYDAGTPVERWSQHLWSMSRQPVAFDATIKRLLEKGDFHFVDVGPSGTLSTFVKYLLSSTSASTFGDVINAFGRDQQTYADAVRRMGLTDGYCQ